MSFAPGTRIGPFEVTAQIGEGGMGEVYQATDINLKRAIAIKVLPALVAADAERLARFQREAEVLAALNHPNIAQIHGLEKSAGVTALVMELVEGPTLADRIALGAVPLDEALSIAAQIADALGAAHEQSIVHRDLKPANIKVRPDGTVKVLDFGLAKAMEPAPAAAAPGRWSAGCHAYSVADDHEPGNQRAPDVLERVACGPLRCTHPGRLHCRQSPLAAGARWQALLAARQRRQGTGAAARCGRELAGPLEELAARVRSRRGHLPF